MEKPLEQLKKLLEQLKLTVLPSQCSMPSPANARRTSHRINRSTPKKTTLAEVAKTSGAYNPNSVHDRVRQWQTQGGGVVATEDVYAQDSDAEESPRRHTQQRAEPAAKSREPNDQHGISSSRSTPRRNERQDNRNEQVEKRDRSRSAPPRRLVSDAHWRKDRSPPRNAESNRIYAARLKTGRLPKDEIRPRPTPDPILKKPLDNPSRRTAPKASYIDDGIRVYGTPVCSESESGYKHGDTDWRSDAKSANEASLDLDQSSDLSAGRARDCKPMHMSSKSPTAKQVRFGSPEEKGESRKRWSTRFKSKTPDGSPTSAHGDLTDYPPGWKLPKTSVFSHMLDGSRKLFSRAEPAPMPVLELPTIESWLDQTPDPFIDGTALPPEGLPVPIEMLGIPREEPESPIATERPDTDKQYQEPDTPDDVWNETDQRTDKQDEGRRRSRNTRKLVTSNEDGISGGLEADACGREGFEPKDTASGDRNIGYGENEVPSVRRRKARRDRSSRTHQTSILSSPGGLSEPRAGSSTLSSSHTTLSTYQDDPLDTLYPQRLNIRRPFPSTGKHVLSTIASVETFDARARDGAARASPVSDPFKPVSTSNRKDPLPETRDTFDPSLPIHARPRLTKHADLISILSMSKTGGKSLRSARSIRTNRSRLETATLHDLMNELTADETKYMRELRTLVDGVIPVLLTCLLSKSDTATAATLFNPTGAARDDPNFTKPIVDMGVALERLKSLHKRVPLQDSTAFLIWARGAQKIYTEYIRSWRMGFQDVVINLAPATDESKTSAVSSTEQSNHLQETLPRNEDGDVLDDSGERVDVAFLLKRPLMRLKYLAKTIRGINFIKPSSDAEDLATKFQKLVIAARDRSNEERARLEDEAAAAIDPTRARDLRTLGPLSGVKIERARRVRARDYFDLELSHSSGQRIDCRVELLLRDGESGRANESDLLICEVDGSGKWLLFAPIPFGKYSARNGDLEGEIVVMITDSRDTEGHWHELLSLSADEEQTGFEWVQMLGLEPVPPMLERTKSFISRRQRRPSATVPTLASTPGKDRIGSPRGIDVPIGERPPMSVSAKISSGLLEPTSSERNRPSDTSQSPRSLNKAFGLAGTPESGLQRTKARRLSMHSHEQTHISSQAQAQVNTDDNKQAPHRPRSFVPLRELPVIQKVRKGSASAANGHGSVEQPHRAETELETNTSSRISNNLTKGRPGTADASEDTPPPPPVHRIMTPIQVGGIKAPNLSSADSRNVKRRSSSPLKHEYEPSTASESPSDSDTSRLGKNETVSMSDSSEDEDPEEGDVAMPLIPFNAFKGMSRASAKTSLGSLPGGTLTPSQSASQAPYKTVPAQPEKVARTIASIFYWSDDGAWIELHPDECSINVTPGLIEAHEMSAAHSQTDHLHINTDVCSIRSTSQGSLVEKLGPLIALELTPLVPIRRGTALDISIRSPPTADSRITTVKNNNVLFRSRNPEECEALYTLINQARINNPTYIALQNARVTSSFAPHFGGVGFGGGKSSRTSSWFSFGQRGRNSYRASSAPTPSVARTDSSVSSMSSAFSALRHFGHGGGRFSISRSTVTSRTGSRANSIYTSSDQSSGTGSSTPPNASLPGKPDSGAVIGLSNAKIRLYVRESASRWRDLGSACLTIMHPAAAEQIAVPGAASVHSGGTNAMSEGIAAGSTPGAVVGTRPSGSDKRIVVVGGKSKGDTLLDVTLGETCFERVAQTGIAVSVWETFEGGLVAKEGGVVGGRLRVFMIQMKGEAETAYTFSIVGKLRY